MSATSADLSEDEHAVLALTAAPKACPPLSSTPSSGAPAAAALDYLDRVPEEISVTSRYADSVDGNAALDAVHFAWAGSVAPGERHYYRLQGPRLLIEWDNTQRNVNHAHAAWRDPEADFGLDVLAAHTAAHH